MLKGGEDGVEIVYSTISHFSCWACVEYQREINDTLCCASTVFGGVLCVPLPRMMLLVVGVVPWFCENAVQLVSLRVYERCDEIHHHSHVFGAQRRNQR